MDEKKDSSINPISQDRGVEENKRRVAGEIIPEKRQPENLNLFSDKNYTEFVFDERHKVFNPLVSGFNRCFSFFGHTLIKGDIPSNTIIAVYGGAAIVLASNIGHDVKICTVSMADEENKAKLDMCCQHASKAGIAKQNLLEPVNGFTYVKNDLHKEEQPKPEESEPIQIKPLDIYIESHDWEDRSALDTAFSGKVVALDLTLISAGSVIFNGNTPPHTVISTKVGDCYIGGASGAVCILNVGGGKGVHATTIGSINTLTTFGNIVAGNIHEDCALSSNGSITIYGKIGMRSIITSAGNVTISDEFIQSLSDHEKNEVLRRITTSGEIRTIKGRLVSGEVHNRELGYSEKKDAGA